MPRSAFANARSKYRGVWTAFVGIALGAVVVSVGLSPPSPAPPVCTSLECGPMFAIGLPYDWNLTANGTNNSQGGCSAPGPGEVEYCVLLTIEDGGGNEFTTSGLVMHLQQPDGSNASFVNVTLLGLRPRILATYTATSGWSSGALALPIVLNGTMTLVLNAGRVPMDGYAFSLDFARGGTSAVGIP